MALKTFLVDDSGDLVLDGQSKPTVLLADEAINQIIKAGFSLWQGNWFRNTNRGVAWLDILIKRYNRTAIIQTLTEAIIQIPYVQQVIDIYISVDNETRIAEFSYLVLVDNEQVSGTLTL